VPNACGACLKQAPHFDATQRHVPQYEFPLDRMVQSLKYARRLAGADFLSANLARLGGSAGYAT
jgi:predicted amidophosphoribosyltransferase